MLPTAKLVHGDAEMLNFNTLLIGAADVGSSFLRISNNRWLRAFHGSFCVTGPANQAVQSAHAWLCRIAFTGERSWCSGRRRTGRHQSANDQAFPGSVQRQDAEAQHRHQRVRRFLKNKRGASRVALASADRTAAAAA
jgi:hypothetical protein